MSIHGNILHVYNYSVSSIAVLIHKCSTYILTFVLIEGYKNPEILEDFKVHGLAFRGVQLCHNKRGKQH